MADTEIHIPPSAAGTTEEYAHVAFFSSIYYLIFCYMYPIQVARIFKEREQYKLKVDIMQIKVSTIQTVACTKKHW